MTRALVTIASVLLAWVAVPDLFVHADWNRTQLADGTQVCRDKETGATFKPPYSNSSQVTVVCNGLTSFIPWLGTAEGQQVGFIKGGHTGTVALPVPTLSSPWLQTDIGSVPTAGTAFDAANVLTIQGSGDFHKDTSAFHFVYQAKTGDWRIDFPITGLTGAGQYRSCGPAVLDSLGVDVKYVYLTPSPATGKASFGGRTSTGAGVYETQTLSSGNFTTGVERIEKIGSVFTGYISTDAGVTFTQVASSTWTPAGTFYIGVHDDSGEATTNSTCTGTMPTLTSLSSSGAGNVNFVAGASGTAAADSFAENAGTDVVCVARSVDTTGAVGVQVQNAGTGTAVAGADFTNVFPYVLSWANGAGGNQCASIPITNRAGSQVSRTIDLVLGTASGGATIGPTQSTHTTTITDTSMVAMKFQPGVYAAYNKSCIPYEAPYGCTKAELLSAVSTEICPHSYIQGMKIIGLTSFFLSNTPGVYTGTNPDRGFEIIDAVLDALNACGKFLIIQGLSTFQVATLSATHQAFPTFTYPSSWYSDGTATGGAYGLVLTTQQSQPSGMLMKEWNSDWRDLAIAAVTAYCTRYEPGGIHASPAFYGIGMIYWNTSLPLATPPAGYDESTFNNQYRTYLSAAHAACPTTNVLATLDFANPRPAQMSTWAAHLQSIHGSMAHNDTVPGDGHDWGNKVYSGEEGSPSVLDYRGVIRNMPEIESPEMCYNLHGQGSHTPAQFYSFLRNGDGTARPLWPSHLIVFMASECDPTYGWAAWKTYLNGLGSATIMNGLDNTLRTPLAVKNGYCESSMTCQ